MLNLHYCSLLASDACSAAGLSTHEQAKKDHPKGGQMDDCRYADINRVFPGSKLNTCKDKKLSAATMAGEISFLDDAIIFNLFI